MAFQTEWNSLHHQYSAGTFFFNILISLNKGRGKGCSVKIEILLTSRELKNQVNFGSWSEIVLKLTLLLLPLLFHSHQREKEASKQQLTTKDLFEKNSQKIYVGFKVI